VTTPATEHAWLAERSDFFGVKRFFQVLVLDPMLSLLLQLAHSNLAMIQQ
jgi:hypothetical protein